MVRKDVGVKDNIDGLRSSASHGSHSSTFSPPNPRIRMLCDRDYHPTLDGAEALRGVT